ncbi:MAG: flagellar biosynthetic protein FliR [Syntrophotaleaceae bacterium]
MPFPALSTETFGLFLVCAARVAALMSSIPVFSSSQSPMQLRAGLALTIALLVFPVVSPFVPNPPQSTIGLALLVAQEALLGFILGFMGRLIFTAVEFGGTIIGYQMGFAAANVFDPQNQRQISLMSQFQSVFAILLFLAFDAHHMFLRAIVHSYRLLPPGKLNIGGEGIPFLMDLTGNMFVLAVRFSAPILTLLLLSGLVLGIMARVFPQLNVFMLSFPINIGLALLVIGLTFQLVATLLEREFNGIGERFLYMFQLLGGT